MLILALLLIVLYAVVNALGAWAVIRRKGWLAFLYMLAASFLVVAGVAMISALPFARVILVTGLVLASLSSLLYSSVIMGRVVWYHHVLRAAVAVGIFLIANFALT